MEIKPDEIESIKTIGSLHGDEVKIIKTIGGLNIAIGKKEVNSKKSEALAAGSHPGIVAHQIAKQYSNTFQPAMFKSEQEQLEKCEDFTNLLPNKHIDFGLELFTLSKNNKYEFILSKHGVELGSYQTEINNNDLLIKSYNFKTSTPNEDIARAFAQMLENVVSKNGLKGVVSE